MAFLMLLHEKIRLQRKVNTLTYKQLRASNKKERITKNIACLQKYYDKKTNNLQKQAQMLQSQATVFFQNQMGLGTQNQSFNPFNMNAGGGITSFVANQMLGSLLNGGNAIELPDGQGGKTSVKFDPDKFNTMMTEYMSGTLKEQIGDDKKGTGKYGSNGQYEKADVQAFMQAMTAAQNNQAQAQSICSQMSSQYQSNISVWLAAQEAQIEAEQDEVLLPLKAEETDMDLERESYEIQLKDAQARLDGIKQACDQGIKDSAPTFGLG